MPAAQATANQATFSRIRDAVNTGDAEVITKPIDEVAEPDMLFHAPVPIGATGAQARKQVWAVLLRAFPDLHVAVVLSQMKQLGMISRLAKPHSPA